MYNYSPGIRDQQAIWDVIQNHGGRMGLADYAVSQGIPPADRPLGILWQQAFGGGAQPPYEPTGNPVKLTQAEWASLLKKPPNVYPNAGLSPQQSPSMPGFFAQPGSSVYSKSMPAPPSAEESAARIRGDIGQQEAQIFQNLQSQGVLPPSAEGYGQAIRSISKPQTMGGVMTIDQQTGAPNYLIAPTPINQPGGIQDYKPPAMAPTPQQPSIYGTEKTPYAIPTSFTSQESPTMQAARLKPLQQDPTWVAQAYGGEAAKTLQAQQAAQQKASQEASQEQMKFNRDALLQQMKGKFELDQTQIKADSDFKIKMYEAEVASGKMNRQDAEKQYGYESQYLNAIGKIDDAYNEAADEYAFMNNGKYEGFEKTAVAQGLQKKKKAWDNWRKSTEPEGDQLEEAAEPEYSSEELSDFATQFIAKYPDKSIDEIISMVNSQPETEFNANEKAILAKHLLEKKVKTKKPSAQKPPVEVTPISIKPPAPVLSPPGESWIPRMTPNLSVPGVPLSKIKKGFQTKKPKKKPIYQTISQPKNIPGVYFPKQR